MRLRLGDHMADRWTAGEGEGLAQRTAAVPADERSRNDTSTPDAPAASATAEPDGTPTASLGPGALDVLNARGRVIRDDDAGPL